MQEQGVYRILVAIETDATRYHGENPTRPALLNRPEAEQMLAHVAADLSSLLPDIGQCSLAAAGALFDQTQLLRPTWPVYEALEALAGVSGESEAFHPRLISLGAEDGVMPVEALQPEKDIPLGLLQLLPLLVRGPADLVAELGRSMEHRFLEEGQLSPHSANWLESAFRVSINHARFMTVTDLNAMFRLQLEHFGFLPLWELLDAAMSGRSEPRQVSSAAGQQFEWREDGVHATFETFDYWARQGGGRDIPGGGQRLSEGYADWTRETRRYLTTLEAHGVALRFHLPGDADETLEGSYLVEEGNTEPTVDSVSVTEHSHAELGTIAVSFAGKKGLQNYYPLAPQGLNEIHGDIRSKGIGDGTVAFPCCILYDEEARALMADSNSGFDLH